MIKSWIELNNLIESFIPQFPAHVENKFIQFRGQSNSEWKLEPSLLRIIKGNVKSEREATKYELQSLKEFFMHFHTTDQNIYYKKPPDRKSLLADMQHYSCPTRLLDWSDSPYIALYFAVRENFDKDGAVYFWDNKSYARKMIAQHPSFKTIDVFKEKNYDAVELFFTTRKNERVAKQRGVFTISNNILKNHCDIIHGIDVENSVNTLHKIEIPKELKLEFLARLKHMNISADTLFPGLDGLGRSISELLVLRKWNDLR